MPIADAAATVVARAGIAGCTVRSVADEADSTNPRGPMTTTTTTAFDTSKLRWSVVDGDGSTSYRMHQETSILGYDRDAGTIDFLVRFDNCGGHCPAHRHITTTSVLVLEGEQHLDDMLAGGERGPHKVRKAGEYHLTTGDKLPHMERGGPDGALVFYSHHTSDGRLYELVDENGEVIHVFTLDYIVRVWEAGA